MISSIEATDGAVALASKLSEAIDFEVKPLLESFVLSVISTDNS